MTPDLFHADEGSGRALVFLPGLGGTGAMFAPQAETFRATHRVIRPDLRGNGRSARLEGPIGTILDRQADDLAGLLDRLAIDRAAVVGVSYGGAVAIRFALRHPGRLAALVVVDSFAELNPRRPMEALILLGSYLTLWGFYLPGPVLKASIRLFYRRWPTARAILPGLVDGFRPTEAALQSIAMCGIGPAADLASVRCPALGLIGDLTKTGIAVMGRAMAPIPGSRLEVVRDSFDPSNLCQPAEFDRALAGFLAEAGW